MQFRCSTAYHASGYLGALAEALHPNTVSKQKEWLTKNCRELKHEKGKGSCPKPVEKSNNK